MKVFKKDGILVSAVYDEVTDCVHTFWVVKGASHAPIFTREEFVAKFGEDVLDVESNEGMRLDTMELKEYSSIKLISHSYEIVIKASDIKYLIVHTSGLILIKLLNGGIRTFAKADMYILR